MEIPKSIQVGAQTYQIVKTKTVLYGGYSVRGRIFYDLGAIHISQVRYDGTPRVPKMQSEAFWHEVTHAILYDMGHPLKENEVFVDAFSKRLNQVVYSAKF